MVLALWRRAAPPSIHPSRSVSKGFAPTNLLADPCTVAHTRPRAFAVPAAALKVKPSLNRYPNSAKKGNPWDLHDVPVPSVLE